MKKISLLILLIISFVAAAFAQSGHDKISYQSVVRDGSNHLLYDTEITVAVSIANSGNPAVVYSETHTVTSNANGLISFLIGDGNSPSGNWDAIQWNRADITLVTSVNGTVLSTHTLPLSAVPYALYAKDAAYADSVDINVVKHYVDQQGFLTEEMQVLSISNDTIFLTGGSWVKLPASFSGDYNDLVNKPDLAAVATSGDYNDLVNKPDINNATLTIQKNGTNVGTFTANASTDKTINITVPTKTSELNNDSGFITADDIPAAQVQSDWNQTSTTAVDYIKNKPNLATVATSGDYNDLSNQPDINNATLTIKNGNTILGTFTANAAQPSNVDIATALPTVNDATLTIKRNGTEIGTFTANQGTAETVNIEVPTVNDAVLTIKNGNTILGTFTANAAQPSNVDIATALPTVNDATLTIKRNGTEIGTFTANQGTAETVDIEVPTVNDAVLTIKNGNTILGTFTANAAQPSNVDIATALPTVNDAMLTIKNGNTILGTFTANANQPSNVDIATALPTVYNGTLSIKYGTNDPVTFTANQAGNSAITIPAPNDKTISIVNGTTELGSFTTNAGADKSINIASAIPTVYDGTLSITYGANNPVTFTANQQGNSAITIPAVNDGTLSIKYGTDDPVNFTANQAGGSEITIPAPNNATINITTNGTSTGVTNGSFTLNQSEGRTIDIAIPTTVAELTDANQYAKINGNTFTGSHSFTSLGTSITVPSNEDAIKRPVPAMTPVEACTNLNAVNVCDLLAVFDSLTKRVDSLAGALAQTQGELETLKGSTPPVFNNLTLSDITTNSMKATADFTSTGAAITSYDFCIKRSDLSNAQTQCFTVPSNSVTFNGLLPYTPYDVTVSATNMAGTTSSNTENARTLANEPSGVFSAETVHPRGIKVTVDDLDFGGAPSGTVKIYYKKKGNADCSNDISDYGNPLSYPVSLTADDDSTFVQIIENLDPSDQYCVMVDLINANSSKAYGPEVVTSGSTAALTITSNANSGTLDVCETSSATAVYTAVPSEGEPDDYTYQWEIVGTSVSQNTGTTNHVEFAHAVGTYTISCTATSTSTTPVVQISNTYSVTVTNTGHVPSFLLCSDSLSVNLSNILYADTIKWGDNNEEIISTNIASHNYQTSKVYAITAKNGSGCAASKEFPIGVSTMHPCTVSSKQTNERGASETSIDSLQDYDGNWYAVAQIGNLCWMKSNLRTTHYSDGTAIANGTGTTTKNSISDYDAYYYRPTSSTPSGNFAPSYDLNRYNFNTYGLYYNWTATMRGATGSNNMPSGVQGVCPDGWHVPSEKEWDTLIAYVQTLPNAMTYNHQQIGYQHVLAGGCEWEACNNGCPGCPTPVRNSSEFTAIPAGQAASIFSFNKNSGLSPQAAFFWSSTGVNPNAGSPQARNYTMYVSSKHVWKTETYNSFGFSVRCVRDYENVNPTIKPTVTTDNATDVGINVATLHGSVTTNDVTITSQGFKWKADTASNYNTEYMTGDEFVYNLTGLKAGTMYTYFAFATYDNGTELGQEITFTTKREPSVSTGDTSNLGMTSATLHGTVTNLDDVTITAQGFEYKLNNAESYTSVAGSLTGNDLSANLTGLQSGQTYTYKAFITYNGQTVYGHDSTFTTKTPPTVTTNSANLVGEQTATLNGTITNPDHVGITARGFQWKLATAQDYTTTPVNGDALEYNLALSGLTPGTEYTYHTYITYAGETHYSTNEMGFITKTEPTVYTLNPVDINFNSVTLKGTFSNVSNLDIEPIGFEWKESTAADFTNEVTQVTVTVDELSSEMTYNLTGLTMATSYDYRAFITHAGVKTYQNVVTFSTWTPPTVTTDAASNISTNKATLNGTVNNPSNVNLDAQGFKFKADEDDSYTTISGTITGNVLSATLSLQPNKTYHFKSFITYGSTTIYGNEIDSTFTTKNEPTVETNAADPIGATNATLKGTITNLDGVEITKKGFLFKASSKTEFDSIPVEGDGLTFELEIDTLNYSTDYTYKAFVTFDGKTKYGDDVAFTTTAPPPALSVNVDPNSTLSVCSGGSTAVTYKAKVKEGANDVTDNYSYIWIVPDNLQYTIQDTMCMVIYTTSGSYTVTCKASPAPGDTLITLKDTTIVSADGPLPSFSTCEDGLTVTVINKPSDAYVCVWGDFKNPSGDIHTYDTSGIYGIFVKNTAGCSAAKQVALGSATLNPCTVSSIRANEYGKGTTLESVHDIDGNWYGVVKVGNQCWMRSNLRTTHFSDGTQIQNGTGSNANNATSASVPYYYKPTTTALYDYDTYNDYNSLYSDSIYGLFYNWSAVMHGESSSNSTPSGVQGVCPHGWHVPSKAEWNLLATNAKQLPGATSSKYANVLSGGCDWKSYSNDSRASGYMNAPSRNVSGFTVVAAGDVHRHFAWTSKIKEKAWFSTSSLSSGNVEKVGFYYNDYDLNTGTTNKDYGLSVRCLRNDTPGDIPYDLFIDAVEDNPAFCPGDSKSVTYTASVKQGANTEDGCSYVWSVPDGVEFTTNGNTCTVTYSSSGAYVITCSAFKASSQIDLTNVKNVEVSTYTQPSFTFCDEDNVVTLKAVINNPTFLDWGDDNSVTSGIVSGLTHSYSNPGTYSITVSNNQGCSTTKTVAVAGATISPCLVSNPHINYSGGGYKGANDGKEIISDTNASYVIKVTDFDGNEYPVVQIGSQCWMAENLRCTHSPSTGTYLVNPEGKTGDYASYHRSSKHAQWLLNDSATFAPKHYGLLYNWCAAVDTYNVSYNELPPTTESAFNPVFNGNRRGLCPKGWHVPTDAEWSMLEEVVYGQAISNSTGHRGDYAGKLSKGCDWVGDNVSGRPQDFGYAERNSFGFGALPAGSSSTTNVKNYPYFYHCDFRYTFFWTATSTSPDYAYDRDWGHEGTYVNRYTEWKSQSYSVRCVRDAE